MPKFSANLSLLFAERPLVERIAAAKASGFEAVEIQFPYELPAQSLRDALTAAGVDLVLFNVPAGDLMEGGEGLAANPGKRDDFRRALDRALAYADVLKPRCVNVLPGRAADPAKQPYYVETLQRNLAEAAKAFAELGVRTTFEAINTHDMPGFLIHSGKQMLALREAVNDENLYLQYDIYHMTMMGEEPARFISAHTGVIGHIQFADVPGRGQPGTGKIDFPALFRAVDSACYKGLMGAEYRPTGRTEESLRWMIQD